MSRKHNTKHSRSQSKYPERLRKRGLKSASVRMETLEELRRMQHAVPPTDDVLDKYLQGQGR